MFYRKIIYIVYVSKNKGLPILSRGYLTNRLFFLLFEYGKIMTMKSMEIIDDIFDINNRKRIIRF